MAVMSDILLQRQLLRRLNPNVERNPNPNHNPILNPYPPPN